ncbi:MAG: aspartate aminotransferase family protein [Alphaproteobacteria bacterium]|nr:aspartate aminotransferase family protein [Alphaproteobacteria bacterium]
MPNYNRCAIAFERGEGAHAFTADGTRYLDFMAGIAVNCLGHAHPHLVEALKRQGEKIWHCSNIFQIPDQERMAERLVAATFADTAFFCNSGAEAVECGIKMIRKYHDETGNPDKFRIICATESFHGRTLTTIAAGGQDKLTDGFGPDVEGFDHVAFNNLNEMRATITDETAAILIEPIQGEGGITPATIDYMRGLRAVADEFGLLLMLDEIQCGMGRSGSFFYYEQAGIAPDIMAVAKGIGGGFPVGACLATEAAAVGMRPGAHGSTYGGNPLAMAVANAVLDIVLEPGFLDRVGQTSKRLHRRLEELVADHPKVFEEVRGVGLMLGLKCVVPSADVVARLRDNKMLTVGAGANVVRLLPPLIIDDSHIDEAIAILDLTARQLESGDG